VPDFQGEFAMEAIYTDVARRILECRPCVALTGAGISAESGIATFRSRGGLWAKYDPAVYASIEVFRRDPSKYWQIRGEFIRGYDRYRPNADHAALAELEAMGIVRHVITQNIDGLHKKAGSRQVTEIHGSLREIHCLSCRRAYLAPNIPDGTPPRCECGGVLKPDTVLFGEQLPPDALARACTEVRTCGVLLVIGTSAVVYPAASLPHLARQHGAAIVEINIENAFPNPHYTIVEPAGTAMARLLAAIKQMGALRG
jgi:NAD-dependent deacetylase